MIVLHSCLWILENHNCFTLVLQASSTIPGLLLTLIIKVPTLEWSEEIANVVCSHIVHSVLTGWWLFYFIGSNKTW